MDPKRHRSEPGGKSRIAPARRAAFDLLCELRLRPATHSDDLLCSKRVSLLSSADRNLATALVMGTLRWQLVLDERIGGFLTQANPLAEPVEVALELGALQLLLFDRIPPHAAIFESVELVKESGNPHVAGMVNAVLRKLVDAPKLGAAPLRFRFPEDIARVYAHPAWMVARWVDAYGMQAASAICRFDQYPPPATIRLIQPNAEAALVEEGIRLEPATFLERARRVVQGDISATRAFAQGLVRIQDEGSQLIAELAGQGAAILDCCAAPGGKTAILAERNPQASILACDIRPNRLQSMRKLLSGQRGAERISYRAVDLTTAEFDRQFDLVLCDAPCSGTGTLARNPEIRHRLDLEDLGRQQARQVRLLTSAMKSVAEGGRLVYSTCSLEPEENERVVARALELCGGFRLRSWADPMGELERQGILLPGSTESLLRTGSKGEFLRTIPGLQPFDGFFAALLTREG